MSDALKTMRDALTKTLSRLGPSAALLRAASAVLCAFAFVAGPSASASAQQGASVSLAEYRRAVRGAASSLEELASLYEKISTNEDYENWSRMNPEEDVARTILTVQRRALGDARRFLPPTQNVEREGGTLNVSNAWLHGALDEFAEKFGSWSNGERARRVREMVERLRALDARLAEYEEGRAGSAARDKEAEKGRLASILRGPDFNKQAAKGGAVAALAERIQKAINDFFETFRPRTRPGAGVSTAVQMLVFGLALAVFVFVLWRFWLTRRGRLSRVKLGRREPRVILGEQVAPDARPSDLLAEAEGLARAGDMRGAIRKAYVALLVELGDRNVLRLARHKTNRDYLHAVRQLAPQLYSFMQPLTVNFERYWYGYERATEDDWRDFLTGCRRALDVK